MRNIKLKEIERQKMTFKKNSTAVYDFLNGAQVVVNIDTGNVSLDIPEFKIRDIECIIEVLRDIQDSI